MTRALTRTGRPAWDDDDYRRLLESLAHAGFGHIKPQRVRQELDALAENAEGTDD